jgi:hypothetical protein
MEEVGLGMQEEEDVLRVRGGGESSSFSITVISILSFSMTFH